MVMPRPRIMGILNLTPDSFSDGGRFLDLAAAVDHALKMVEEGAEFIDLGGESTRPGARFVSWQDEWQRIAEILKQLCKESQQSQGTFKISLDSWKPQVIERALDLGIGFVNSVRGIDHLSDQLLTRIAQQDNMALSAMHMHGEPETMQKNPLAAKEALEAVADFYDRTWGRLKNLGFRDEFIFLDPGIGFGKTDAANLQLLAQAMRLSPQYQFLVGFSRKGLLGRLFKIEVPLARDGIGKALELGVALGGIQMIRTHEVGTLRRLLDELTCD